MEVLKSVLPRVDATATVSIDYAGRTRLARVVDIAKIGCFLRVHFSRGKHGNAVRERNRNRAFRHGKALVFIEVLRQPANSGLADGTTAGIVDLFFARIPGFPGFPA